MPEMVEVLVMYSTQGAGTVTTSPLVEGAGVPAKGFADGFMTVMYTVSHGSVAVTVNLPDVLVMVV